MTDMNTLTWVDWAIVIFMLLSILGGISQGFFRSVCSLGGLILGLLLAAWNYPLVAAPLKPLLKSGEAADIIGFLLIAVIVMVIAGLLGALLSKALKSIGLGCLDRIAGGIFGFFQGILLVTLAILVTVAFYPQAHWLLESKLPRHFFAVLHVSARMSPDQLAERVKAGLKTLEGEAPEWMHPHEEKP
ncbi:MAG: CvpA family protein [Terracidiphilus sp.]|jgi:membrane protein required for colicin V production